MSDIEFQNILVVNVNWVGDVIFSTPVFRALKARYPKAKVTCLAVPRVREILESCPAVDEVLIYDEKGADALPWRKWALISSLKARRFDAAFLLHRSWSRALLLALAGIPVRVGHNAKGRGMFLTHSFPLPPEDVHRADSYLHVLESFGIAVRDRACELTVSEPSRISADKLLAEAGIAPKERYVVVNAGGNWDLKRWPPRQFALLIQRIDRDLGLRVVIPGGPFDVGLAREISERSGAAPVILAGKTDLKQLMAVMAGSAAVVSSDSGPLHLAASVGAPVVGIFGPTRPEVTGPRGRGRSAALFQDVGCNKAPCYYLECPDNVCMRAVDVDQVLSEVRRAAGVARG